MTLQEIADAIHPTALPKLATLQHTVVTGVSTDTRSIKPGDIFVALKGPNFNGNDYVGLAFDQGAVAAVVDAAEIDRMPKARGILVTVQDTRSAYGAIASAWRQRFSIPVVAITGSVGKTTTKEMVASSLSSLGSVLKTEINENNEVGVPKLLLQMTDEHKAVVVEMGMRGAGQIAHLSRIAQPTVGVITKIAENHIELLGSVEAIADAKGELIDSLPSTGLAVLNADDPFFERLRSKAKCRVVSYGFADTADIRVTAGELKDNVYTVQVSFHGLTGILFVPSPSQHDVGNALAATIVALELGVKFDDIAANISGFSKSPMRMEIVTTPTGATILSDCYNASPTSMKSALDTMASFPAVGRKVAFLGDMRELGNFAPQMHRAVAEHAGKLGVEVVYAVGPLASEHYGAVKECFADSDQAAKWVRENMQLSTGDVALVKGSRAMMMEKIVEALNQSV